MDPCSESMCAWAILTVMPQTNPQTSSSANEPVAISAPAHCRHSPEAIGESPEWGMQISHLRFPDNSHRPEAVKPSPALRLCALTAAIVISVAFGCGNPHAILNFTAPSTATAGSPFTVTVTVTVGEKRDTIVNSYIHFTSSDPTAVLSDDYTFTPADAGSHTWTNGFILKTPGSQTVSGSMYDASGINGTANVTVSP